MIKSDVAGLTHVEEDPVLLVGGKGDGDVGAGHHVQRLQLHVGRVVAEAE
jgi:hypothetical protein